MDVPVGTVRVEAPRARAGSSPECVLLFELPPRGAGVRDRDAASRGPKEEQQRQRAARAERCKQSGRPRLSIDGYDGERNAIEQEEAHCEHEPELTMEG